jgi:hexosaminidase
MSKARSILGLLIMCGAAAAAIAQSPPEIDIVPRPESLELSAGKFVLDPETRIVAGDEESRRIARLFNDYLLAQHGLRLKMSATRAGRRNTISFSQSGSREFPEEGYLLRIGPEGIRVTGRHAGLFYGMQTLTQLLPLELEPTIELPVLEIADHPLSRAAARRRPALLYGRVRQEAARPRGTIQDQPVPLAPHRRPGLAYRDQALSEADAGEIA